MSWIHVESEIYAEMASLQAFEWAPGMQSRPLKQYDPANYRARRAFGVCAHCSQKARPGLATCERHAPPKGYVAPSRLAKRVMPASERAARQSERAQRMAALHRDGWSLTRLSKEFDVDRKTIRAQFRRMGVR